jgi:UDP-glucose 4-epimerase
MQTKKVLITGGAGFIGSHTALEFLNAGYEVKILDNLRTGDLQNLEHIKERIAFTEGDIRDAELVSSFIDDSTAVVHLAALVSVPESIENPSLAHDINVTGMHTVLNAARVSNAVCFISASSAAVYGSNVPVPTPEVVPHAPSSPYGLHKSINEQYGKLFAELYCMNITFLRFFNVYGPRQKAEGGYASVIPAFIKKVRANEPAVINGSGTISRDFIHVRDVAKALYLAVEHARITRDESKKNLSADAKFNVYNIATGKPTSLDTLWNTLCKVSNKNIQVKYGEKRVGDIEISIADVSKAHKELKFDTNVSLEDGLKEIV